jgi:hypothetical protein
MESKNSCPLENPEIRSAFTALISAASRTSTIFNRTAYSLAGGSQDSIGNAEEQALLVAGSNPSFHTAREESHFPFLERYSSHCRTLQAHLNETRPQHHPKNMFILHLHVRLSDRRKHIHRYSHSLRDSSCRLDAWTVMK